VHLHPGLGGEQVVQPLVQSGPAGLAAQHVDHHDNRSGQGRVAERVVEHRAQVLLEL